MRAFSLSGRLIFIFWLFLNGIADANSDLLSQLLVIETDDDHRRFGVTPEGKCLSVPHQHIPPSN